MTKGWRPDELVELQRKVEEHGPKWKLLAKAFFAPRSGDSVRNAFHRRCTGDDPHPTDDRSTWSHSETQDLVLAVVQHGDDWMRIYDKLETSRGAMAVRQRWRRIVLLGGPVDVRLTTSQDVHNVLQAVSSVKPCKRFKVA